MTKEQFLQKCKEMGLNYEQMDEIRLGLENMTIDKVKIYIKTFFKASQMEQIRLGLEEDLNVSIYATHGKPGKGETLEKVDSLFPCISFEFLL